MNKNKLRPPIEILSRKSIEPPKWLSEYHPGDRFYLRNFMKSRVVFYPGAGSDFHPIKLFGSSGAAHGFILVDYGFDAEQAEGILSTCTPSEFSLIHLERLSLDEVFNPTWERHFDLELREEEARGSFSNPDRFALFAVLEGHTRIAVLYLGFEAVEAYDRLFCQGSSAKPPYGILVQNHGMGGDWCPLADPDSHIAQLAEKFGRPRWLIGQDNYENWRDYEPVSDITHGGMHSVARRLFLDKKIVSQ